MIETKLMCNLDKGGDNVASFLIPNLLNSILASPVGVAITFLFCLIYVFLLTNCPKATICISVSVTILVCLVVDVLIVAYVFFFWRDNKTYEAGGYGVAFTVVGAVLTLVILYFLFSLCSERKLIPLSVGIYRAVGTMIGSVPTIIFVPIVFAVVEVGMCTLMFMVTMYYYGSKRLSTSNISLTELHKFHWFDALVYLFIFFLTTWFNSVAGALTKVTCAGVAAEYYFSRHGSQHRTGYSIEGTDCEKLLIKQREDETGEKLRKGRHGIVHAIVAVGSTVYDVVGMLNFMNVLRSMWRTFRYSTGTILLGGIAIPILGGIRSVALTLHCGCILGYVEKYTERIYVIVGLTGKSFRNCKEMAYGITYRNAIQSIPVEMVLTFPVLYARVFVLILNAVFTYFASQYTIFRIINLGDDTLKADGLASFTDVSWIISFVLSLYVSYIVVDMFTVVLSVVADTLTTLLFVDEEMSKSADRAAAGYELVGKVKPKGTTGKVEMMSEDELEKKRQKLIEYIPYAHPLFADCMNDFRNAGYDIFIDEKVRNMPAVTPIFEVGFLEEEEDGYQSAHNAPYANNLVKIYLDNGRITPSASYTPKHHIRFT